MLRYAVTIFISAFLLFQVQPLIGRFILPWFGGGPSVWTTCMLFFQLLLLGGYLYSHLISILLSVRSQAVLHATLLLASLLLLPVEPSSSWKPQGDESPSLRILLLLLASVGAPYFMLATTGPLMQRWFSRTAPGRSPWRLYALSNVGSLLALLTYPVVFEPWLQLRQQSNSWTIAYIVFVALAVWCAIRLRGLPTTAEMGSDYSATGDTTPAGFGRMLLWLGLAAAGSVMLLATTNQLCIDVATVPFLWILPLSIYLISFIICFDSPQWYDRRVFGMLLLVGTPLACWILGEGADAAISDQIAVYSAMLFIYCMACHGELVHSRPAASQLTLFYLLISGGGALGGLFVAIVAPRIFDGYWEYHAGLMASCLLILVAWCVGRVWQGTPALAFWIKALAVSVQLFWMAGITDSVLLNRLQDADRTTYFGVWLLLLFTGLAMTSRWQQQLPLVGKLWVLWALLEMAWLLGYAGGRFPEHMTNMRYAALAALSWLPAAVGYALAARVRNTDPFMAAILFRTGVSLLIPAGLAALWHSGYLAAWQVAWIAGTCTLTMLTEWAGRQLLNLPSHRWGLRFWLPGLLLLGLLGSRLIQIIMDEDDTVVLTTRNFYGVLQVREAGTNDPEGNNRSARITLTHGQIQHGFQYLDTYWKTQPTTYYGPASGAGLAIRVLRNSAAESDRPLRVGVIGLGTGTLAAYGRPGDYFRFYEINPEVQQLSESYFTYLSDSQAQTEVMIGDARIVMERELGQGSSQRFDVLAVDAFSSDAIPVHLLTTQSAEVYRRHLSEHGLLAIHISNRFLDLNPVVRGLADYLGWYAFRIEDDDDDSTGIFSSTWILLTPSTLVAADERLQHADSPWAADVIPLPWTDDYSALWRVLKF